MCVLVDVLSYSFFSHLKRLLINKGKSLIHNHYYQITLIILHVLHRDVVLECVVPPARYIVDGQKSL